jgi:ubiquinone/menaquinone biosynthesis C-methylase UbiE
MIFGNKFRIIKSFFLGKKKEVLRNSKDAYKIWADCYDEEKDNLMLYYDEIILKNLLEQVHLKEKTVLDFGSGTGRNWYEFLKYHPGKIIGCDISPEMINKLKIKFPGSESYLIHNEKLDFLNEKVCDIIISTLVISHIKNIKRLFQEWDRLLKASGDIIITDFHPDMFMKGGARTFKHAGKTYKVEHYIHEVRKIEEILSTYGFKKINLIEKQIEENVKSFYIKKNALHVYEKFRGVSFIYGLHLRR